MGSRKRSSSNIRKLSGRFGGASLSAAAEELERLRQTLDACGEFAEELSQVVQSLKQGLAGKPSFFFSVRLTENETRLRDIFADCSDIRFRPFAAGERKALMVYLFNMTDITLLEKNVLETLMGTSGQQTTLTPESLVDRLVTSAAVRFSSEADEAVKAVMNGEALLLVDGMAQGLLVGAVKYVKRNVESAQTETSIRGAHDAFNETLDDNIALVRRRARDPDIKVKLSLMGERSQIRLAIVYAASLVKPGLVAEVERRLGLVKVDQVVTSHLLVEWIIDHPWSPFPQVRTTERPETVVASLYGGLVVVMLDNSPHVLLLPSTFSAMMQSIDDYIAQPVIASLIRVTRYIAALLGIFLPAVYVAIVSYHPGMLPTNLAISVAEIRMRTPYPAMMEVLIMEFIIEVFQEAVTRLPEKIAPAATIVGGFVIGTTIVQSGLVSAMLVVAIAGTAIASYSMPSYELSMALRWLRVPMVLLAGVLGFFGVVLGYLAVIVHLCSLRSFGESYLGGLFDITLLEDMKDQLVRLPATLMGARPKQYGPRDRTRAGD